MEYKTSPCVGSGLCCKTAACGYGVWSEEKNQCIYLESVYQNDSKIKDDFEVYRCSNHDYIKKQSGNEWMPAFGAGCCMTIFNTNRQNIIKAINSGNEKVIAIFKVV